MVTENELLKASDIEDLKKRGISEEDVERQLENFRRGFPYARLARAATQGDGITQLTKKQLVELDNIYHESLANVKIVKFVPASGAASRMFKDLFTFESTSDPNNEMAYIVVNYFKFAFEKKLTERIVGKKIIFNPTSPDFLSSISSLILREEGLNYGNLPKGLIEFHKYKDHSRTAFEEHLVEAAEYAVGKDGIARVHFTISPEHHEAILKHLDDVKGKYEKEFNVTYDISFSTQKQSTDTIAVNLDNEPFRDNEGKLLFRPGGHGALISNLSDLDADIVFIKNIDNVVPDRLKQITYDYKEALGSYLMDVRNKVFAILNKLQNGEGLIEGVLYAEKLGIQVNENETTDSLFAKLNRPIRICGMVENEGEPGGGPFWVKDKTGRTSLQIIESSQIDHNNPIQKKILDGSTHFNPVDLVCSITDYKGDKFDLNKFIDAGTGFISYKSKKGVDIKQQELPGLWNGAMANWITLFVEVPGITFNPVKKLVDLLRTEHKA